MVYRNKETRQIMNIGIYFGSQTGTTDGISALIARQLTGHDVTVQCVLNVPPEQLAQHELLILGTSTWDIGELPYDWQRWWPNFDQLDLSGRSVAIFGLGDQSGYPDTFCDAMRVLYDKVIERGACVTGGWSTEGYQYEQSAAVIDSVFVGLPIDEMNQPELTHERVTAWCAWVLAQAIKSQMESVDV
jgi:flavodoxin I